MAMILDAFMSKFNGLLVQMVQDEVGMLLGIPGEIEKLEQTVGDIQCVIADAEKKQTESMAIKRWIMELKDAMYDADDIMDLCQIKAEERLDHSDSPSSSKVSRGFLHLFSCFRNPAFAHEIGTKIKNINSRLEGIAKRKADLGLIGIQTVIGPPPIRRVDSVISHKTDPLVVMKDIVGEKIEEDTGHLVSWLTGEESGVKGNIGVVAIVGMSGIGKTTLAKRIFNDSKIKEEFDLKIWACVSKNWKGVELLKCIIREAGSDHGAAQERSELVPLLESVIKGKKFFLVLDDIWPESIAVWDGLLRAPMSGGAHGSRMLVTTRDERVATGLKATKSHHVEKMSDEDGWSLLIKQVFENEEEIEIEEFKDIGLKLVEKCDGLPVAIKSIGGVLCMKTKTIGEWQAVLESNLWFKNELPSGIHQSFYLSYEDLPSPLKQCFIFCSLFSEDHEFYLTDLIYFWCSEGFLQDNENLWELGYEYYRELLLRNLLEKTEDRVDIHVSSKMHDLLWTFGRYLGKDENFILREGETFYKQGYSPKLRRLSIEKEEVNSQVIKKEKWLRTLMIDWISENALADLCATLPNLRILDLKCCNITTLPDSVGALMHLRYLRVCSEKIRTIPESIGYLRNLICLDLSQCNELEHIPCSIINLKQLRHLCLGETKVEKITAGLKNLKKLIQLCGFRPSKTNLEGFSSLDELETLTCLITLLLSGLEQVTDKNIAKRAKLQCKYKLKFLGLECTILSSEDQLTQTNEKKVTTEDILNELCPPPSIEILSIGNYIGSCLPNWLNLGTTLPNLRNLVIFNCHCFEKLATLGQLPNLNFLEIRNTFSVSNVGEEFLLGDIESRDTMAESCPIIPAFPKLNELIFVRMANWKEWQWNKGVSAMPKLKRLSIRSCPQLRSLPVGLLHHATSLEYLKLKDANCLTAVENLPSIKEIHAFRNQNLERISNLPGVSNIIIENCPNLKTMERLNALQSMKLADSAMDVLQEYLMTLMPFKLRIDCNEELLRKITSQGESGSEWHKFKHIPKVAIYSMDQSFYATYQKTPFSFTTNIRT